MVKLERTNAGYKIEVSVVLYPGTEVVIGYKKTSLGDQYVCWYCSGGDNYYWGKYCHTYCEALCFLHERIGNYIETEQYNKTK